MKGLSDARVQLRVLLTAINAAVALTVNYFWSDIPNEMYIAWGAVLMAGFGVAEGIWDAQKAAS